METNMGRIARFLMTAVVMTLTIVNQSEGLSLDVAELLAKGDPSECALTRDCDPTLLSASSYENYYNTDKKTWGSLGLDPHLLHINEISVGFVPAFREKKSPNTPEEINKKLYKPMAIMGDYISLSSGDRELKAIDWHIPTVLALDGNPVWCIALMPSEGLDMITYEVAHKIAAKMKQVNELGITVWLRFAHEMNGDWYMWEFKNKWQLLANEVKAVTNKTYMLWSPNAMFGNGPHEERGGYTPYFPDPGSVDIVGLSFYHWGDGPIRINKKPTKEEAIKKLYDFAKIYGPDGWNKPVIVAETAACYTTYQGTTQSVGGDASELEIKMAWLHLLVDRYIKRLIPALKAVIWFEITKEEAAPGHAVRNEDFRLVLGNSEVSDAVRKLFASYQSKELSERSR